MTKQQEIDHLKEMLEERGREHEAHLESLRSENRQLVLMCDDYRRLIDLYRANYDHRQTLSLREQTPWRTGLYGFGDESAETRYYNPSIARVGSEEWLFTRRWRATVDGFINDIVRWDLQERNLPSRPVVVTLPRPTGEEHYEDPRTVGLEYKVLLSCCTFIPKSKATQHVAVLDRNAVATDNFHYNIGGNGDSIQSATSHEKNWLPFIHDGEFMLIYSTVPHKVVAATSGAEWLTRSHNRLWGHGHPRGGTPPVRVGDEYFSFFHSSLPWRRFKNQYFMGAYAFEAKPPFRITRMSTLPILSGSPYEPHNPDSPLVVFPGGALFDAGRWWVVYGINDNSCGWIEIPHDELLPTMRLV